MFSLHSSFNIQTYVVAAKLTEFLKLKQSILEIKYYYLLLAPYVFCEFLLQRYMSKKIREL